MASEHFCARCSHSFKAHVGPGGSCVPCHRLPPGLTTFASDCPAYTERACCDGFYDSPHALTCPANCPLTAPTTLVTTMDGEVVSVRFGDGPLHLVDYAAPIYDAVAKHLSTAP